MWPMRTNCLPTPNLNYTEASTDHTSDVASSKWSQFFKTKTTRNNVLAGVELF